MELNLTPPAQEMETLVDARESEKPSPVPTAFSLAALPGQLAAQEQEADGTLAGDTATTVREMKLPGTLAEALALSDEISRIRTEDANGEQLRAWKLAKVAAHIHALSQGPQAPPIDHKKFWHRLAPTSALARLAKLYPKSKN